MKHELFGMRPNTEFEITAYDNFGVLSVNTVASDEIGILLFEVSDIATHVSIGAPSAGIPDMNENAPHRLFIYNVKGQEVFSCELNYEGYTRFVWKGKDNHGQSVGKGVYFLKYGKIKKKLFWF
jgi:flagellar hook assembly protein FlgD